MLQDPTEQRPAKQELPEGGDRGRWVTELERSLTPVLEDRVGGGTEGMPVQNSPLHRTEGHRSHRWTYGREVHLGRLQCQLAGSTRPNGKAAFYQEEEVEAGIWG